MKFVNKQLEEDAHERGRQIIRDDITRYGGLSEALTSFRGKDNVEEFKIESRGFHIDEDPYEDAESPEEAYEQALADVEDRDDDFDKSDLDYVLGVSLGIVFDGHASEDADPFREGIGVELTRNMSSRLTSLGSDVQERPDRTQVEDGFVDYLNSINRTNVTGITGVYHRGDQPREDVENFMRNEHGGFEISGSEGRYDIRTYDSEDPQNSTTVRVDINEGDIDWPTNIQFIFEGRIQDASNFEESIRKSEELQTSNTN